MSTPHHAGPLVIPPASRIWCCCPHVLGVCGSISPLPPLLETLALPATLTALCKGCGVRCRSGHSRQQQKIIRSCHPMCKKVRTRCRRPAQEWFLVGCSSPLMHATRRAPHGASCLAHVMSAWSVKTRHAPSHHCGDARVYTIWSSDYDYA